MDVSAQTLRRSDWDDIPRSESHNDQKNPKTESILNIRIASKIFSGFDELMSKMASKRLDYAKNL